MKSKWIYIAVAVALGLYLMSTYNGLVKQRQEVKAKWAQVEVQLQRRTGLTLRDLIANFLGFTEVAYYQADAGAQKAPDFEF